MDKKHYDKTQGRCPYRCCSDFVGKKRARRITRKRWNREWKKEWV